MNKEKVTTKEKYHRQFQGVVVSVTENKTIHVEVVSRKKHQKYKKQYNSAKKFAVHDEKNEAKMDDVVLFEECRPLSKTKKWKLVKVIKKES